MSGLMGAQVDQNYLKQQQAQQSYATRAPDVEAAPSMGLTSAFTRMMEEINRGSNLADNLRSTMGLSDSRTPNGKDTGGTLGEMVDARVALLRETNDILERVLIHLNS